MMMVVMMMMMMPAKIRWLTPFFRPNLAKHQGIISPLVVEYTMYLK